MDKPTVTQIPWQDGVGWLMWSRELSYISVQWWLGLLLMLRAELRQRPRVVISSTAGGLPVLPNIFEFGLRDSTITDSKRTCDNMS